MKPIYEVSQINEYLKCRFDEDPFLGDLLIKGEISNYKLYPSGHHYFSLKDSGGALRCVMFKGSAYQLRFRPENGMKVIAAGRISVFPRDGAYQLYCTQLVPDGIGDLHIAFEQLKSRLQAQGLFDPSRKKPIPSYPHTIAIITSSAGAALRDMLRILRARYPLTTVKLLPVRVQGVEAPAEIAGAIRYANTHNIADLIITGRGGGSMEDLWAFNDERVALAISASRIPVISAVGHEPDFTIADFVADLRAATPSNGAELAVPDQMELRQKLNMASGLLSALITKRLKQEKNRLTLISHRRVLTDPMNYIEDHRLRVDHLQQKLIAATERSLTKGKQRFIFLTAKLDAMSPFKVLTRGYSLVKDQEGKLIRSAGDLASGREISITFREGSATATVKEVIV